MNLTEGSRVKTKHGEGVIQSIDTTTYSIALYIIKITTGNNKGETIALTEQEVGE